MQNKRESRRPSPKNKLDFEHKVIQVRRVTRVVAGGRRFSFSVAVIAGDRKGKIGVGVGKASDTALAIDKAINSAKKNMIKLSLTDSQSIPYEVNAKFNASIIKIKPSPGRGLVAGSSARTVLDLAGIKDVSAKLTSRSKNKLNNARVAMNALALFTAEQN